MKQLSTDTNLVFHVFNKNNIMPPTNDTFNPFSTKAFFRNVILPPAPGAYCRYGAPFRGGENPIVKYEIGIGSTSLGTEAVPYREMITPCLQCYNFCSRYNCNATCDADLHVLYQFEMKDFYLNATRKEGNETLSVDYYLTGILYICVYIERSEKFPTM